MWAAAAFDADGAIGDVRFSRSIEFRQLTLAATREAIAAAITLLSMPDSRQGPYRARSHELSPDSSAIALAMRSSVTGK